jgi:putative addiction module killer protein
MRVRLTDTYLEWIVNLRDVHGRARGQARVDRLAHGNPGHHQWLPGGICELKIDVGPGYRVYYCERADEIVVLLGGDKSSQQRDIEAAIALTGQV